jgi:hypothetical protein
MDGTYEIFLGGEPVGQAAVTKQGLYYHISCRLKLTGSVVYKLQAQIGDRLVPLGVPVPEGSCFVLRRAISAKQLGQGQMRITAVPKHAPVGENFVPLSPETPFAYLHRLEQAFLTRQNGVPGISFRDQP